MKHPTIVDARVLRSFPLGAQEEPGFLRVYAKLHSCLLKPYSRV